jgi:hypothetical protein
MMKRTNGAPASGFLWWVKGPRRFEAMDGRLSSSERVSLKEPSGAMARYGMDVVESQREREERGQRSPWGRGVSAEPNTAPLFPRSMTVQVTFVGLSGVLAVKIGASNGVRESGGHGRLPDARSATLSCICTS